MAEFGNLPTIEPVVEKLDGKTVVTLGTVHFTEGNAAVRAALEDADVVELRETFAQRYRGQAPRDSWRARQRHGVLHGWR